ncbi:hypothetical protein G8D19_11325 [Xanthomonas vesicatoria]|uniref:hypothetical protein n=1 Tax=Xanthomonas vesicatoria TaxID=56460 RepID=UPI002412371E|nr:hypothetical protein [Xanthomonas vesicatoria]MDG4489658.1 hypothetical protein [Xanthomonas vesicatoria]
MARLKFVVWATMTSRHSHWAQAWLEPIPGAPMRAAGFPMIRQAVQALFNYLRQADFSTSTRARQQKKAADRTTHRQATWPVRRAVSMHFGAEFAIPALRPARAALFPALPIRPTSCMHYRRNPSHIACGLPDGFNNDEAHA